MVKKSHVILMLLVGVLIPVFYTEACCERYGKSQSYNKARKESAESTESIENGEDGGYGEDSEYKEFAHGGILTNGIDAGINGNGFSKHNNGNVHYYCEQQSLVWKLSRAVALPSNTILSQRLQDKFSDDVIVHNFLVSDRAQQFILELAEKDKNVLEIALALNDALEYYYKDARRARRDEGYLNPVQHLTLMEILLADYPKAIECWHKLHRRS